MAEKLDYENLIPMIGFYRLGKDRPYIVPLSEIDTKHIQLQNCYKISLYWGQKVQFGEHEQKGDKKRKNSFRYNIVEKVDSYYLGKEVQKSRVTNLKHFDFDKGDDTMYIQLANGEFLQGKDTLLVIDPAQIFGTHLTDMFDPDFYLGLN